MTHTTPANADTILRQLASNAYPPLRPDDYAEEAGYHDACGDYEHQLDVAKLALFTALISKKQKVLLVASEKDRKVYSEKPVEAVPLDDIKAFFGKEN